MKIGLIDVDGHGFPNLALMRISAYHRERGDDVEWYWGEMQYYDIVYMSKVFSSVYSKDVEEPLNAGKVIKGGTGYCISLGKDGREHFDKDKNVLLPSQIETMRPDYTIYPEFDFAVSMTSRGCPRQCPFCHVAAKEGYRSEMVASVKDFWDGQKLIKVLDPNITACRDKTELFRQYLDTGATIDFTQGLDIRLLTDDDIDLLNSMRLENIHFAWDNPKEDLSAKFERYANLTKHKPHGHYGTVYVLTNYNSTMPENLHRITVLRDLGFDPYVMIYNKPSAPQEVRYLQRWCNNRLIYRTIPDFYQYDPKRG